MSDHFFLVSRDRICEFSLSVNPDAWKRCKVPPSVNSCNTYTIVYNKDHLDIQKYDCGCIIYHNKYYPDFKYPELIWLDFFGSGIGQGDKLVKYLVRKSNKK